MPDIGLLQGGAPRQPLIVPPELAQEPREIVSEPLASRPLASKVAASDIVVAQLSESIPEPVQATPRAAAAAKFPGPVNSVAPPPIRWSDLLWLAFALVVIVGTGIGIRDPWPADEPRFAALARDMALSHEWLFPRVGGDLYQDKPPLFFWLLAFFYTLTGSVRWSFLIPSFLAAGGVLFLVYDYGRRAVSREAGLAAALLVLCTLQFVLATRGAQIDPTLCFLTTLSLYALSRHLLLGPSWGWYVLGGFVAGVGIFTKGVGFLPVLLLIPFFLLRGFGWRGLAPVDAGRGGWRWWLAPLAMLLGVSLWFVPMLIAVATSGSPEYVAYRDEILFDQTVNRYAGAWHHVKAWYYFIIEVIPPLWLPWSLLLFWLVPRFKSAFHERNARVWLPLGWVLIVLAFFSASPGKRGIYILPALPALAFAAMPVLEQVLARKGVRLAGFILAGLFWLVALALLIMWIANPVARGFTPPPDVKTILLMYLLLCGAGLYFAWSRAPLLAWPAALGALTVVFSYWIAPWMNGERSGKDFVREALAQVQPAEQLALVAYKEQFLLYLDRPTFNFGHRRWREGPQEAYDAAAWLNAGDDRVLLMPGDAVKPCFEGPATSVGESSSDEWFLVRGRASEECAAKGDAARAISYPAKPL